MSEPEKTPANGDLPMQRRCLLCGEEFPSEGFGERICRRCKSTKTWKAGR